MAKRVTKADRATLMETAVIIRHQLDMIAIKNGQVDPINSTILLDCASQIEYIGLIGGDPRPSRIPPHKRLKGERNANAS